MKVILAPDKFKGSLSASDFCLAVSQGIEEAMPDAKIVSLPLSDGGDGFLDIMASYGDYDRFNCNVSDPLFRTIKAEYLFDKKDKIAVLEMARTSGLMLLDKMEQNCMYTSSIGLGEMIIDVIKLGAKKIIIGLGGSATNDGGIGMASALGYDFLDKNRKKMLPVGGRLSEIEIILPPEDLSFLKDIHFTVLTDVDNPFYGEFGAAKVYAKQKGASSKEIVQLEQGMRKLVSLINKDLGKDFKNDKGFGAAGGLGGGCQIFLDADLVRGSEYMIQISRFKEQLEDADLLITGEGKLDIQSSFGKIPIEVARMAKTMNIPVIAICGQVEASSGTQVNYKKVYSLKEEYSLEMAINETFTCVKNIAYNFGSNHIIKDGEIKSI